MDFESIRCMESDNLYTYNFNSSLFYSVEQWDYTLHMIRQDEYIITSCHIISMYKSSDEQSDPDHSLNYLRYADSFPHKNEGEAILLENIPANATRILDIGSGSGRLIKMIKENTRKSCIEFVALDISPTMLKSLKHNFANDTSVKVIEHDLDASLPDLGYLMPL